MANSSEIDCQVVAGRPATLQVPGITDIGGAGEWVRAALPGIRAALLEHGALYLRGLPIRSLQDFAAMRDELIPERTPYREKATPRTAFGHDVYSSTDLPPSQAIRMHNENSYTLTFPGLLLFGCLTAPAEGGATPVADCRRVLPAVPSPLAERMRKSGWRLNRSFSEYVSTSWQTAFATDDPADVAEYCDRNLIAHGWRDDGTLRTSQVRPGIIRHPVSGEQVWFNHQLFWNEWALDEEVREALVDEFGRDGLPFSTEFGDGSPLTREDLMEIQGAYDAATVRQPWNPGDLLLVDNILTAHGRDPFHGDRRIVVAMGEPVELTACRPTVPPAKGAWS
ncbi:alpha-ketoglutarate-dependent taurine dioxygenase [Catenulispora sp. EB89]|uniref:TauD/TfdA family dioxygenase n=1 Tax=Catenulispora sp. EB89 TaxID=3156257 RepID=UPI003518086C